MINIVLQRYQIDITNIVLQNPLRFCNTKFFYIQYIHHDRNCWLRSQRFNHLNKNALFLRSSEYFIQMKTVMLLGKLFEYANFSIIDQLKFNKLFRNPYL